MSGHANDAGEAAADQRIVGSDDPNPPAFSPTHVSHKQVEAYPISAAEFQADGSGKVGIKHPIHGYVVVLVPTGFLRRPGAVAEGDMLVRYAPTEAEPHGYLSHSPRTVFEDGYSPVRPEERTAAASRTPDSTGAPAVTLAEAEAAITRSPAPRVTHDQITAAIAEAEYFRAKTLTICVLTLRNGFTIVGTSACASPENYDQAVGERYAYEAAFRQIWAFEGYLLRERLSQAAAEARGQDSAVQVSPSDRPRVPRMDESAPAPRSGTGLPPGRPHP